MRRLLLIITLVSTAVSMWAGQISREQAMRQAQQFLNDKGLSRSLTLAETELSKARSRGEKTPDYYYVFNAGQNQGFIIISGDDRAVPVLGYSDKGSFDADHLPSNLTAWLEGYAEQIRYLQENGVSNSPRPRLISRAAISPMLTSRWDQNSPYNDQCGLDLETLGHIEVPTGCVATAMAQVMYYYKYPAQTTAEIPEYVVNYNGVEKHTFESVPAGTTIDWGNMLDYYGRTPSSDTEEQRAAVAKLMLLCGKSVKMAYSNNGSSSNSSNVADALKNYFGYNQNVVHKQRWAYSDDEWEALLYQELASGRPVVYSGQTAENGGSGHSFVLDGYQDGGYYHVNWGWGQLNSSPDGYFLLSALNPSVQGTGGASGGYNYRQDAVVGIAYGSTEPFTETVRLTTTALTINGATEPITIGKNENFSVAYNITSRLVNTYSFRMSLGLYKGDEMLNTLGTMWSINNVSPNAYNTSPIDFDVNLSSLTTGRYKIVPLSKERNASDWYQNESSDKYFLTVDITADSITVVIGKPSTEEPTPQPEVTDEQRKALSDDIAKIKALAESKLAVADENMQAIEKLESSLGNLMVYVAEVSASITLIREDLKSEWLTAGQVADYQKTLDDYDAQLTILGDAFREYSVKLAALKQYNNEQMRSDLYDMIDALAAQAKAVAEIETKSALEEAQAQVSLTKEMLEDRDPAEVKNEIATLQTSVEEDLASSTLKEQVSQLQTEVKKAIEEAKAEKEKAELAEAKKECEAAIEGLKTAVAAVESKVKAYREQTDALQNQLLEGYRTMETLRIAIDELKAEIDKNKATVRTRSLSDEEVSKYTEQIVSLQAKLDDLKKQYDDLQNLVNSLGSLVNQAETKVGSANAGIAQTEDGLKASDLTAEAIRTMTEGIKKTQTDYLPTDVELAAIEELSVKYSQTMTDLSSTLLTAQTAIASLSDEVKTTIAGIGSVEIDEADIQGRYDLNGRLVGDDYRGVMILKLNNGKTKTIFKR